MSARASLRKPQTPPQTDRKPVAASAADDIFLPAPDASGSPALQLQNMLVERLGVIEASALKEDKYDIRVRLAYIVGISAAGWATILLAAKGLITLIAG